MKSSKKLYVCVPLLISLSTTMPVHAGKFAQLAGTTTITASIYCGCIIAKNGEQYRKVYEKNLRTLTDAFNENKTTKITLEQYTPPADKLFQAINVALQLASYGMVTTSNLLNELNKTVFKPAKATESKSAEAQASKDGYKS